MDGSIDGWNTVRSRMNIHAYIYTHIHKQISHMWVNDRVGNCCWMLEKEKKTMRQMVNKAHNKQGFKLTIHIEENKQIQNIYKLIN